MNRTLPDRGWRGACAGLALALILASPAFGHDAASLRAKHASLQEGLANNSFGRPLALESTQTAGDLKGDVYAVVDHPFSTVQQALRSADNWCDILILHLNVKRCRVGDEGGKMLTLSVGRKFDQPIEDAYELDFAFRLASNKADYLQVLLTAPEGPLSTKNYRIQVEATPVDPRRTVIHMSYAYGYGFAARMAMQTYLATLGSKKVGFTITGHKPDGKPEYIRGVLGLLERNTMRYYLAIDAYLAAYSLPPAEQVERCLREWHASTERYAPQLHEMEKADYLEMKRKEIRRQKKD